MVVPARNGASLWARPARCFAGRLKRAMAHGQGSWGEPWVLMNTRGARGTTTTRSRRLGQGRPITTFKGRRVEDVVAWFKSRPQQELDQVEVVVLDMSKSYYSAIKEVFGDQVQVIDRFHVVKQAVEALDSVLRSVQKQLDREEAKELKKLALRHHLGRV